MATILVVDDSTYFRLKLKEMFESEGHKVISEANNGRNAFVEYQRSNPDVVTMDISMPTLGGIEAVERILNYNPEAKIIMVSALGQRQFVLQALKMGAKHFVVKPIVKDKLMQVMDIVLEMK